MLEFVPCPSAFVTCTPFSRGRAGLGGFAKLNPPYPTPLTHDCFRCVVGEEYFIRDLFDVVGARERRCGVEDGVQVVEKAFS